MKLPDFKLERFFSRHEFSSPYLLCSSDCETCTIEDLISLEGEAGLQTLLNLRLGYTEAPGSIDLRRQIARLYENMEEDNILVTAGAEEAIFIFMHSALQAGDHVIVQYPCYQSLYELGRSSGCKMTRWKMEESRDWSLDLDKLRRSIRSDTRAIIINLPHNPTGYLMPKREWKDFVEMVRERNILLFSDEVYRGLEYNQSDRLPAACDMYDKALSLGVMSKSYGLAGLRIGWLATSDRKIYRQMAAFKDYTSICNSAPSELLALIGLKHGPDLIQRNCRIIKENLGLARQFFSRHRHIFSWVEPKAGSIAFPHIKALVDVDLFCSDLANSRGVLLLPGSCYGYKNNFRIGLGRTDFSAGLERWESFIKQYL